MCRINPGYFPGPRVFEACETYQRACVVGQGNADPEARAYYLRISARSRAEGFASHDEGGRHGHLEHEGALVKCDVMLVRKGRDELKWDLTHAAYVTEDWLKQRAASANSYNWVA